MNSNTNTNRGRYSDREQNENRRGNSRDHAFSEQLGNKDYDDRQSDSFRDEDYNRPYDRNDQRSFSNVYGRNDRPRQQGYGSERAEFGGQQFGNQYRNSSRLQGSYQFEENDNPSAHSSRYVQQSNPYNPNYNRSYAQQENTGYGQGRYSGQQYGESPSPYDRSESQMPRTQQSSYELSGYEQPSYEQPSYEQPESSNRMSNGYGQSRYSAGGTHNSGTYIGQYGSPYGSGDGSQFGRDRWSSQNHYGKGPKNYSRSDDRIKEEVCEALTRHSEIDPSDVTVEVRSGEVTLSGTIDDRSTKRRIEEVVEDCPGVKDVQNRLKVSSGPRGQSSSSDSSASRSTTNGNGSSSNGASNSSALRSESSTSDKKNSKSISA